MFRDVTYLFEYTSIGGGEDRKQFLRFREKINEFRDGTYLFEYTSIGGGEDRKQFLRFREKINEFRDGTYLFEYTSIGGGEGRKQFLSAVPREKNGSGVERTCLSTLLYEEARAGSNSSRRFRVTGGPINSRSLIFKKVTFDEEMIYIELKKK